MLTSLQPGDTLDRYVISALLGEGGMGTVYRARDTRLQRRVALKVLRRAATMDSHEWETAVARMLREARASAALNHPNVVAIYDVGDNGGAPFIAMELIEGTSLRKLITSDTPMSSRLRWLIDVARALCVAHRMGLVHRDIKPENVMLRDDGLIKVVDFGIARWSGLHEEGVTGELESAKVTDTGQIIGTPAYMAPEQVRGDALDGRADQFSWGVLAYEVLSGKLPFGRGRDAFGVIAAILTEQAPPLPGVPEVVEATVHRALSKSPDHRFPSMDAIVEALEPLITADFMLSPATKTPRSLSAPTSLGYPRGFTSDPPPPLPSNPPSARDDLRPAVLTPRSLYKPLSSIPPAHPASGAVLPAEPPRRARWPLLAGAIALLAGAGLLAVVRQSAGLSGSPASAASPSPTTALSPTTAPSVTPITDTELPKTSSPEALQAYREGLQALRDAAWGTANERFERAVALDPSCAAAHLRLAMTSRYLVNHESREIFRRAMTLRSSLGERDLLLLGAYEPLLLRDPPDTEEAVRRLRAAWQKHPGDVEFAYLIESVRVLPPPEEVFELTDRILALDPEYACAFHLKAAALRNLGKLEESLQTIEQCLSVSPSASDCLDEKGAIHMMGGQCEHFEEDTRLHLLTDPSTPSNYQDRAAALYALGRPRAAIQATLEQGWNNDTESRRPAVRHYDEGRLAVAEGRLEDAERSLREAIRAAAPDVNEMQHLRPTLVLVELEEEMGRVKEAAEVAGEFLTSRDAWRRAMTNSVWKDATMRLLSVRLRAGAVTREEYVAMRTAWLPQWTERLPGSSRFAAWLYGYAYPAETADEAKEALRALPDFSTSAPLVGIPLADALMGKVYLLADRPEEALPYLKRAVARCDALGNPIQHTLSAYRLGKAHEARGEKEAACSAYGIVLDRWSRAKASVTARAAGERAKALGCSPDARARAGKRGFRSSSLNDPPRGG